MKRELLDCNPAGARFRVAKRKRTVKSSGTKGRFLNPEQARAFLAAVSGGRHEALHALAMTTGLRPEELYGLRSTDPDLPHCRLTVNQVLAKTRRKKGGDVPMDTYGHLFERSYRDSGEKMEKLFGGQPKALRVLTIPDHSQAADKNSRTRLVRAAT